MTPTTRTHSAVQEPPHWIGEDWPAYLDATVARPTSLYVLVAAAATGIAFDIAARAGAIGLAAALGIVAAGALVIASRRLRNRQAYALVGAAALFAVWLPIRTSPWLIPFDVLAACGLIALGASLSSGGSVWDLSFTGIAARGLQAATQFFLAPAFLVRAPARPRSNHALGAVVRGVLIAVPVVVVLGALLASADAVFASFVRFDAGELILHVVLVAVGAWGMATILRLASLELVGQPRVPRARLGAIEWTVVLVALNGVLAAFAIARLLALTEGGRRVIASAGLTYAEYARSGFFQMVGAALLATATLLVLRTAADLLTRRQRGWFVALALGVVGLTLAMVVSAFHRLVLYEAVFGLTMLRVYVQVAIVWIGIVLLLVAARVLGVARQRAWLTAVAGGVALALLFALNVMNPEAFVARHNIAHKHDPAPFDEPYLSALSDDAVSELAKHPELKDRLCASGRDDPTGWAAYNVARQRARAIRAELCQRGG